MNKKIILALDVDLESALQISKKLKDHIYGLKIGTLFNQIGIQGLKEFDAMDIPLFIDQKWSDIPSTVARHIENFKNFKNILWFFGFMFALAASEAARMSKKRPQATDKLLAGQLRSRSCRRRF